MYRDAAIPALTLIIGANLLKGNLFLFPYILFNHSEQEENPQLLMVFGVSQALGHLVSNSG